MVGVGETDDEMITAMDLIREANVDLITIGQYLAPSKKHLKVDRFPEPHLYDEWAEIAIEKGFSGVASGPFVRSSFKAGLLLRKTLIQIMMKFYQELMLRFQIKFLRTDIT